MKQSISSTSKGPQSEFAFTDKDFKFIQKLIFDQAGISLPDTKRAMVYSRLVRQLRRLRLPSFIAYTKYLETNYEHELPTLINALTTNLTYFFREAHHFEYISNNILPHFKNRTINIWSAGCSTGQEPYSIAHTVLNSPYNVKAKILASDLDTNALGIAKAGVYNEDTFEKVPKAIVQAMCLRGKGENQGLYKMKPQLQELIEFKQINLTKAWNHDCLFDIIFCRNVVIYFDLPTKEKLFSQFIDNLAPRGHLLLGHSELISGPAKLRTHNICKMTYQKRDE